MSASLATPTTTTPEPVQPSLSRTYGQAVSGEAATIYKASYPSLSIDVADQIEAILADPATMLATEDQREELLQLICGSDYEALTASKFPAFLDIPRSISFTQHDIKNFSVQTHEDPAVQAVFATGVFHSAGREHNRLKLLFTSKQARDQLLGQSFTFKKATYRLQAPNAAVGRAFFDIAIDWDQTLLRKFMERCFDMQIPVLQIRSHTHVTALDGGGASAHSAMTRVTLTNRRLPSQLLVENRAPTFLQFEGHIYPIYTSSEYGRGRNRSNGPRERRILNLDPPPAQMDPPAPKEKVTVLAPTQSMATSTVTSLSTHPAPVTPKPALKRKQVSSPSTVDLLNQIPVAEEWSPPVGPPCLSSANTPTTIHDRQLPAEYLSPHQIEISNRFAALAKEDDCFPLYPEPRIQDYDFTGEGQAIRRILPTATVPIEVSAEETPSMMALRTVKANMMELVSFGEGKKLPKQDMQWQFLPMDQFQDVLNTAIADMDSQQEQPVTASDALEASIEAIVEECDKTVNADEMNSLIHERRDLFALWLQSTKPHRQVEVLSRLVTIHTVHRGLLEESSSVKVSSAQRFRLRQLNASKRKVDFLAQLKAFLTQDRDDEADQLNLLYHQALALFEILTWIIAPCLSTRPIIVQSIIRKSGRYFPVKKGRVWDATTLYLLLHSTWGQAILKPFARTLQRCPIFQALQQLGRVLEYPIWNLLVNFKLQQYDEDDAPNLEVNLEPMAIEAPVDEPSN